MANPDDGTPGSESVRGDELDPMTLAEQAHRLEQEGRSAEAAALFAEAYAATGDARFIYGEAVTLARAGDCPAALQRLEAFIASGPTPDDIADARHQIEQCRAVSPETPAAPPVADRVPRDAGPPLVRRTRWLRDVTGGVLVGLSAVSLGSGGALLGSAHVLARDRTGPESRFVTRTQQVDTRAGVAIGLMCAGSAALIGGVVRYVLVARRSERSRSERTVSRRRSVRPSRRMNRALRR